MHPVRSRRPFRPPLNFITIHWQTAHCTADAYFLAVPLSASLVFWGSSHPPFAISYVDSLFLVVSAMTEAGLNTVNLSQMTTWQQVILWLLIIIGSSIWVSIWTVLIRKHAFERRFRQTVKEERQRSHARPNPSLTMPRSWSPKPHMPYPGLVGRGAPACPQSPVPLGAIVRVSTKPARSGSPTNTVQDVLVADDAAPTPNVTTTPITPTSSDHIAFAEEPVVKIASSLSQRYPVIQRHPTNADSTPKVRPTDEHCHQVRMDKANIRFPELTSREREKLGGTEYRALKLLSILVPLYFVSWQILGSVVLGAWIANNQPQPAQDNAISPWWNGVFNAVSAFNNSGMSVLDLNVIPYSSSYFVLMVMGILILAGNTAYPIFLRFCLWTSLQMLKLLSYPHDFVAWKTTLEYILRYPRRVYTHLFPARQTWWLLFMLFVLNGTDWAAFEVLNFGNSSLANMSPGSRVMDGLFQALAVRSGGFYVVSIPTLYIGVQVLYVIMMYIAVYPVVITMRHSNVYEEQSLGIYDGWHGQDNEVSSTPSWRDSPERSGDFIGRLFRHTFLEWHGVGAVPRHHHDSGDDVRESRISFITHQIQGQLSHDLWWLVLAVLAITIIETRHFLEDPVSFSIFNIVFEVVSAYGCVGISVGLPDKAYSLSGGLYPGSKLILCAVMLRGRHRGLPVALDRAVQLPGEIEKVDEENNIQHSLNTTLLVGTRAAPMPAAESTSEHGAQHKTLKYSLLGPSLTKAGQDTVDQSKVSEIIYNASKGSKYFNREEAKDKVLTEKIEQILAKKRRLEKLDLTYESRAADQLVAELELSRDLTQRIVHVDCDAFYAAVEQLDRPELKDVPFAVGAGVLTTCNYAARKFGCRSGMAGFVAKKLCPNLLLVRPNFEKYTAKAREVRDILGDYDSRFESASIDEAYLNVTEYCALHGMTAEEAVQHMRDEIYEKTKITVSAGIAANATLAKICSNINKPNGQYSLPNDRNAIMNFMQDLPTRKVNGIGRVLERELQEIGIRTCGDIHPHRHFLGHLFGEKTSRFLLGCHLGLGRTHLQPAEECERKSIGTESTFRDMSEPMELKEKLRQTAIELEKDMRKAKCKGRTLVLKVKLHTYEVLTRQVVLPRAICLAEDLYNFSLPMLTKLQRDSPHMKLRLMGLRCTHLVNNKRPDTRAFFGLQPLEARDSVPGASGEQGELEKKTTSADIQEEYGSILSEATAASVADNVSALLTTGQQEKAPQVSESDAVPTEGEALTRWWDCPICGRPQPAEERRFNDHLDTCLSRKTIRDAVQNNTAKLPPASDTVTIKRTRGGVEKKHARAFSLDDPKQKKLRFG
ncbi:cation transport protein-domain-containing protein [Poronia punctata]|nr:cation transport protein-domain-containing protein [Poronia punctata]